MPNDAYIRLGPRGPKPYERTDSHQSLVFVDIAHGSIDELRRVPQGVIGRPASLLVRCESPATRPSGENNRDGCDHDPSLEELESIRQRLQLECPVGVICQPPGEEPRVEGMDELDIEPGELLTRARAIELRAMLGWGNAVWRPTDYHYRLPSGEHAGVFIRLADAIRAPRDAQVIASWLRPHLEDGLAVVCDSGTMSPVVESLRASALAAGMKPGPTAVLEQYPASALDVSLAVQDVIADASAVLGIVSVNSSGRVADWLLRAVSTTAGAVERWGLEIMVDRQAREQGNVRSWLPLRGERSPLGTRRSSDRDSCELCQDPKTARLVPINPTSFDGMLPGQVRQLMPFVSDARRNCDYWEQCSDVEAIGLMEKPDDAVKDFRPSPDQMPIHFRLRSLLDGSGFREVTAREIKQMIEEQSKPKAGLEPEQALTGNADLVLVPWHETKFAGYDELWKEVGPVLAREGVQYSPFPVRGDWDKTVLERVRNAEDILVFALGLVTGGSLTKALTTIQATRKDEGFKLRGLVMHARTEKIRDWETLVNAYAKRLFCRWQSFIVDRSPLKEEADVLDDIDTSQLSDEAARFLGERQAFCAGDGRELSGMFWGARSAGAEKGEDRLSPHSIFGENLNGVTTLIAVGSAMELARQLARERAAPEMRVFELPALTVSYYDPMILSAAFRWLRPEEAWWGERPEQAHTVMARMLARAERDHKRILVPELLLAVTQGKVPDRAVDDVEVQAELLLRDDLLEPDARAAIEVGLLATRTRKRRSAVFGTAQVESG